MKMSNLMIALVSAGVLALSSNSFANVPTKAVKVTKATNMSNDKTGNLVHKKTVTTKSEKHYLKKGLEKKPSKVHVKRV